MRGERILVFFLKGREKEGGTWEVRGCQCAGVTPLPVIDAVFSTLCVFETAINEVFIHLNINVTERPRDLQNEMKTLGQEVLPVLHAPHDPCLNSMRSQSPWRPDLTKMPLLVCACGSFIYFLLLFSALQVRL